MQNWWKLTVVAILAILGQVEIDLVTYRRIHHNPFKFQRVVL